MMYAVMVQYPDNAEEYTQTLLYSHATALYGQQLWEYEHGLPARVMALDLTLQEEKKYRHARHYGNSAHAFMRNLKEIAERKKRSA